MRSALSAVLCLLGLSVTLPALAADTTNDTIASLYAWSDNSMQVWLSKQKHACQDDPSQTETNGVFTPKWPTRFILPASKVTAGAFKDVLIAAHLSGRAVSLKYVCNTTSLTAEITAVRME